MIGKKLLIWGVLISSFAFFYGLMYHNMNLKLKTVNQEKSQILQQNELLKDNWLKTLMASDAILNNDLLLFKDDYKIALKDAIRNKSLVMKIPYAACQPCLERELQFLASFEKKGFPTIIISTYPNMQELSELLAKYQITAPAYLINSNTDFLRLDESYRTSIYTLILNKDLSFDYLFFPIQTIDKVSEMYYQIIEAQL